MAYAFDADNECFTIADNATLSITGALTLSIWGKHNTGASSGTNLSDHTISKQTATGNQRAYRFYVETTGTMKFDLSSNGTVVSTASTGTSAIGTTTHHLAAVFNPSTQQEIFIDGVSAGTAASPPAGIFDSTAQFEIGHGNLVADNRFGWDGSLWEAAVWKTNLTTSEIVSLAKGYSSSMVRRQSLVLYMPLVRNVRDLVNAFVITTVGTPTVVAHGRIIRPHSKWSRRMKTGDVLMGQAVF